MTANQTIDGVQYKNPMHLPPGEYTSGEAAKLAEGHDLLIWSGGVYLVGETLELPCPVMFEGGGAIRGKRSRYSYILNSPESDHNGAQLSDAMAPRQRGRIEPHHRFGLRIVGASHEHRDL